MTGAEAGYVTTGAAAGLALATAACVAPNDVAAMDRLRADCPQVKDEPNADLDFALRLIHAPKLYDRALALGGAPTLTVSSEATVGEAAP